MGEEDKKGGTSGMGEEDKKGGTSGMGDGKMGQIEGGIRKKEGERAE